MRCARQSANSWAVFIGFGVELKNRVKNSSNSLCLDSIADLDFRVEWIWSRAQSVISWVIWIVPFGDLFTRKKRR